MTTEVTTPAPQDVKPVSSEVPTAPQTPQYTAHQVAKPVSQPVAVETCSRLEKVMEALALECENEEEAKHLRSTFFLFGLYYLDDKAFDKETRRLVRSGFSRRLVKNATHLVEELSTVAIALMDHKFFGTPFDTALSDRQTLDNKDLKREVEYIKNHIDLDALKSEDCIYTVDDMDASTVRMRIPGGDRIKTTSRLGKAIEGLCAGYDQPQYNDVIRKAFAGFAVGILTRNTFTEQMNKHKRMIRKSSFERVIRRTSDNIFELFNKVTLYKYDPALVAAWLGGVSVADWEYLHTVLGDVAKEQLLYADEVEPLREQDLLWAKEKMKEKDEKLSKRAFLKEQETKWEQEQRQSGGQQANA